ncbi:hypothetical protein JFV29_13215 [Peribacillus sp. TH16]|nr:hypothetical protein [Peribacillus sp. TH16]MBK5482835.1 hypothetical protein [Peribacillus sp. TH16]
MFLNTDMKIGNKLLDLVIEDEHRKNGISNEGKTDTLYTVPKGEKDRD